MKTLRPYQEEAIQKFADKTSAYFAMEMRLGKSLTTIRWLMLHGAERVLVVAPKTTLISWKDELDEEGLVYNDLTRFAVDDRQKMLRHTFFPGIPGEPVFCLINYETLPCLEHEIRSYSVEAIVLDEATEIKNHRTNAAHLLLETGDRIAYKAALSGMPNPQGWTDVWSQMAILHDGQWMRSDNFYRWRNRYAVNFGREWFFSKKNKATIRSCFHADAYVLTRKDAGIGETKIYEKRSGELPPKAKKLYDHIAEKWEIPGRDKEDLETETQYDIVVTGWLRRLCGGFLPDRELPSWKYAELKRILEKELPEESVVVWFAYNDEIKKAKDLFPYAEVMHGGTKDQERHNVQRRFQAGKTRVLFIQQKLGRFGIRLDKADTAVYFSNDYSYKSRGQSEDRIVAVGKDRPLLYIDLFTENTIEEAVLEALSKKETNVQFLLESVNGRRFLGERGSGARRHRVRRVEPRSARKPRLFIGRKSKKS